MTYKELSTITGNIDRLNVLKESVSSLEVLYAEPNPVDAMEIIYGMSKNAAVIAGQKIDQFKKDLCDLIDEEIGNQMKKLDGIIE